MSGKIRAMHLYVDFTQTTNQMLDDLIIQLRAVERMARQEYEGIEDQYEVFAQMEGTEDRKKFDEAWRAEFNAHVLRMRLEDLR